MCYNMPESHISLFHSKTNDLQVTGHFEDKVTFFENRIFRKIENALKKTKATLKH